MEQKETAREITEQKNKQRNLKQLNYNMINNNIRIIY